MAKKKSGNGKKMTKADKAKAEAKAKAAANRAARKAAKVAAKNGEPAPDVEKEAETGVNSYRMATGVLHSQEYSSDVKIGGFSMQAYGKELVQDTLIELTIGRRYGLIGPNGCGKSSFLKCLAYREVPIPEHIDIFYLEEEAAPSERSALESVIDVVAEKHKDLEELTERLLLDLGPDHEATLDAYQRLDDLDPETFESRAGELLFGLGFTQEMVHKKTKDMSGGWRMRVSLARALFVKPTLLLLDEPTNHLDLEACVWLENYLAHYPHCLVLVSHSQDFLNGVCTNIIEMEHNKLNGYTGNYDMFVQLKQENLVNQTKRYQKEQDDIKHIKQFIASCGTFSNLVRQAKSKQKILDKMYARGLTPKPTPPHLYKFDFNQCEKLPPPVISFVDVSFSYSGKKEDYLYQKVNLGVDCDSRIAIVGPNGTGKSTLLKLMCGELTPVEGNVKKHIHCDIARYHQHSEDQLELEKSPLQFFAEKFPDDKRSEEEWRSHVGRFGITGGRQTEPMGHMSDGIKSRVVFSLMSMGHPNMLLLDEPTNHLDMECIDSLATAIKSFDGGVVLVSHDFRLLEKVAETIWVVDDKSVTTWKTGIRQYKKHIAKGLGIDY